MENQIMYAELINGVTEKMKKDPQAKIISDTGLFLVTTKSNTSNYPELDFEKVDEEALKSYDIKF